MSYITTKEEIKTWEAGMDGKPNPYPSDIKLTAIYEDAKSAAVEWAHESAWHQRYGHKL